jgi:hypothetical protein
MKRSILLLFLSLTWTQLYSQEVLVEKKLDLNLISIQLSESVPIVNTHKNEIGLFILNSRKIQSFLYNSKFELTDSLNADFINGKFKFLKGYGVDSLQYYLYFGNRKDNEFSVQSVNFNTKVSEGKLLPLKFKKERLLRTLNYQNKHYILTVVPNSSDLNVYEVMGDKLFRSKKFDFSGHQFTHSKNGKFFDALNLNSGLGKAIVGIRIIDSNDPASLEEAFSKRKLYHYNNKLFMVLDNVSNITTLVTIDLTDLSSTVQAFKHAELECKDLAVKTNSYLTGNYLFQIKACEDELCLKVTDVISEQVVKTYQAKSNEEISFKNTPLLQDGGLTIFTVGDSGRELDKTKQFFRKLVSGDIGVAVSEADDKFLVTVGGYREQSSGSGGGMMMISPGISTTMPGTGAMMPAMPVYHHNPVMYGHSTSANTRTVYFKSFLQQSTLNHVDGEMPITAFDKVSGFEMELKPPVLLKSRFKLDDSYVLGYFLYRNKHFYLRKFTNQQ